MKEFYIIELVAYYYNNYNYYCNVFVYTDNPECKMSEADRTILRIC